MSQLGIEMSEDGTDASATSGHRGRGPSRRSVIPVLLSLLVVGAAVAGLVWGGRAVADRLFSSPADYAGPGGGEVAVTIEPGDSTRAIADRMASADVVQSAAAFVEATSDQPGIRKVQHGTYQMRTRMAAADAVALLLDPATRVVDQVTLPEGLRTSQALSTIAETTDFTAEQLSAALADTASLGLPPYARERPEGYLFPATYELDPNSTSASLLLAMTAAFASAATGMDLDNRAAGVGHTPAEIVTIASLIQAEAKQDDFAKVSRVIENRLAQGMPLQFDSTVSYITERPGVATTEAERQIDSPYNTYRNPGLPVGPINNPGKEALEAALNPTPGDWLYFVVVNEETGETKFATTYAEHLGNVDEWNAWRAANGG